MAIISTDKSSILTKLSRRRRSLSGRYITLILTIIVVTGLILGGAVTIASVRNAASERMASIEYASTVTAAALMPVIADEDPARIRAELNRFADTASGVDIQCIEILDGAGNVLAESSGGCTCDRVEPSTGLLDIITKPQVSNVPIEIDGMRLATISMQFRPVGLEQAMLRPAITTAVVLLFAMVISALWGGWLVLRSVVEPIGELRDAAESIAEGKREVRLEYVRNDEIGELATSLQAMTDQLQEQERRLLASYVSLETAFQDKAELAERLKHTMQLKSDFVAVASHELGSPLAVMRLFAELLEDGEFGDLDPQLADAVGSIVSATARLSAIVTSLMDVSLLERGLMSLAYSDVALDDVVEQAVEDAALVGGKSGIGVSLITGPTEATVRGDAIRIRQILDNLLSNAIKYSTAPSNVEVSITVEDGTVDIAVADRGRGIDHADPERIFGMFSRGDTADNTLVGGIGLGLPISVRIAQAHGGTLTFEPNPGGTGTVFHLLLPLDGSPLCEAIDLA
ncbi:MAG: HAMP domain-containing sensor histidine kinase [Coriobacteriia bacterium]